MPRRRLPRPQRLSYGTEYRYPADVQAFHMAAFAR